MKQLQADFSAEAERLSQLAVGQLHDPCAKGLAAVEPVIRIALIRLRGGLLKGLLRIDNGHRGTRVGRPGVHLARVCDRVDA